jgi:hypothetical protein
MKPMRIAAITLTLLAVLSLTWGATGLSAQGESPASPREVTAQLLANPDMEGAFNSYGFEFRGAACKVASSWTRFGDTDPRPCWMDAREFAWYVMGTTWVEKIKGETSQVVISTDAYAAGIYQQVSVTKGLPYGFHAAMMTIYESSYGDPQPGHMIKQVGMDPTGGTDPNAATVVWSEPSDQDYGWDLLRRTAVVATDKPMTVFIRVIADDPGDWPYVNQSYLDAALLAQTATAWISAPEITANETFVVTWGAAASPGGELWAYDVQWQDEADGVWHDWIQWVPPKKNLTSSATFSGTLGHEYKFRVRAWQYYADAANYLYSPWWETETLIGRPRLVGKVWGNGPYAFGSTSVSIVGTAYTTVSRQDGTYQMWVEPMADPHQVAISNPLWLSPEPVHGVTFGPLETVTLDWTLRPPDDALANGGFEQELTSGWEVISGPSVVGDPVHTGGGAAMLGGQAADVRAVGYTNGLEQTVSLAHSWNPNLSFWYLPQSSDGDDDFTVTLTVAGEDLTFTPALDGDGWQHQWYSLGVGEDYFTGPVTVRFELWNDGDESTTVVYLDEVSLGRTPGGPFKFYFPLIRK